MMRWSDKRAPVVVFRVCWYIHFGAEPLVVVPCTSKNYYFVAFGW